MYGWGRGARPTFSDWLVGRLQAGEEVPVFIDQYRSPLFVGQAAEVIGQLTQAPEVRGVLNCGGGERLSRYDFGRTFCDVFDFPHSLLRAIEMDTLNQAAKRPRDCSLDSLKLSDLLHIKPLTVREGLERMKRERVGGAPC
ncbi:MAG: sugar nucleotide-binding protein, partial [Candidatus Entotheonellia bacterium]